ncbi:MAG: glycoside hydrolase family 9 protein [Chitinophagaceae bacterium]|nr:glycoside hydrolase family 9 protein [Chitinophagaceae bacterium]
MRKEYKLILLAFLMLSTVANAQQKWIRINQLGYLPDGVKVAVWCSKSNDSLRNWQLIDASTKRIVTSGKPGRAFGKYGPFQQTYRINFSSFNKPGTYYLQAGGAKSPVFSINKSVYDGTADFALRYMRQQRTGFNPFLRDSCHTQDGYVLYGNKAGIADSTYIDVVGGWHDASDYLQYVSTSANATYHLLMAYRDFPGSFKDAHRANGLEGANGRADVLDEAKWGLDWLSKMHPRADWMFNQIGDDRDHTQMRIPTMDSQYGRGFQRPVYFIDGEPQQRGKFMNATTGTSSTAGKFASAFALGSMLFESDKNYNEMLQQKAASALAYAYRKQGVTQTVSVKSPYIYAEENWVDDMELAHAALNNMRRYYSGNDDETMLPAAISFARREKITPWLGGDTAHHYQWYPFINVGHYELASQLKGEEQKEILNYYKEGIEKVWKKASANAFYRGIPFIWCSNNLTTAFAIQCKWYRKLSGDTQFTELEQANLDWLMGCNPWGTSMVYGLPASGDTPEDPHSAFTHLKNYPIDGGLVDGPVYTAIYKSLIGIQLNDPDEYAEFQSDLAVYHDDYGDYSTNEPTMDGTASLIYLLAAMQDEAEEKKKDETKFKQYQGAYIRGDEQTKKLAIVFTGDQYGDGADFIQQTLKSENVKASFFLTGNYYRNKTFLSAIKKLKADGHYLGAHSDQHLLYCDWNDRNKLLVTRSQFEKDLNNNYKAMQNLGINKEQALYFLPPYEWYNDSIAAWTRGMGLQLLNYTSGTLSHADYTVPQDKNYRSSQQIWDSIFENEKKEKWGLNGFVLLMHIGTDAARTDKFYRLLPDLIQELREKGYDFLRVDDLFKTHVKS